MKPRSHVLGTTLLALALVATGCSRSADQGSSAPSGGSASSGAASGDAPVGSDMVKRAGGDLRIGQPWYLVGGILEKSTTAEVTLTFDETTVGGRGPVNSYSADYTATAAGDLTIAEFASTLMAGPEPDMAAEAELLSLLAKVDGYTAVQAGELYLFDGDMNVLTYSATPATG